MKPACMVGLLVGLLTMVPVRADECPRTGTWLQVLGSGGPELQDKRASSSYLLWHDQTAKVLIDSGGGSALRFGQSGAEMADLDVMLFTHLHVDHSADFPALMKSSWFETRTRPLPLFGPTGNKVMPALTEFIDGLFDAERGIYRYLSEFISSTDTPGYKLHAQDVSGAGKVTPVYHTADLRVSAIDVAHGPLPALAWRVELGGKVFVFSGDTNGDGDHLARLAHNADVFVAHNAVPEGAAGVERRLHMPPGRVGEIARQATVKRLVLSHRMLRTLGKEKQTLAAIKRHYTGPVDFADDLDCFL